MMGDQETTAKVTMRPLQKKIGTKCRNVKEVKAGLC